MIVCVDVDYRAAEVATACIGFHDWADAVPSFESVTRTVRAMHGAHRIPTLLKRVDRLARDA